MHSILPSKVAKIPAKISNLEVLWPQGNHAAQLEGGQLPLSFPSYVPKETLQPPSCMTSPGRPTTNCVFLSEVAKIPAKINKSWVCKEIVDAWQCVYRTAAGFSHCKPVGFWASQSRLAARVGALFLFVCVSDISAGGDYLIILLLCLTY